MFVILFLMARSSVTNYDSSILFPRRKEILKYYSDPSIRIWPQGSLSTNKLKDRILLFALYSFSPN